MDDIKNTLLLINGNIDSTDEYFKTQIGDQSGNFWINKNQEVEYSEDIRKSENSSFHKSIKLNDHSKLELVDAKHLFNFNNREFSVDAWVKFDETEYFTEKNHVFLAKWNETNSPMDSKLFKFYYKHIPNKIDVDEVDIFVSSTTNGFTFNGIDNDELTLSNKKIYNFIFDASMNTFEFDGESTSVQTGLPRNFKIYTIVDDILVEDIDSDNSTQLENELPANLDYQWANVRINEQPVASSSQTSSDYDNDVVTTETETSTQTEEPQPEYGLLTPYVSELQGGIRIDLSEASLRELNFKIVFTHVYEEEVTPSVSPISDSPRFGISDDTNTNLLSEYENYLNEINIPTTQSVTISGEITQLEPLTFSEWLANNSDLYNEYSNYIKQIGSEENKPSYTEWLSSFNYRASQTETFTDEADIPHSSSATIDLVEINNEATIDISVVDDKNADGKLVFEFNGLKGYKSEYRTLKLNKNFIFNNEQYDTNDIFNPTLFSEVNIQNESNVPTDLNLELNDEKSKIWISDTGILIYPVFKDFNEFYRVPGDVKSSEPQTNISSSQTQDAVPTQTTTNEQNIGLVEYEEYLSSSVDRTFKFIPIKEYNSELNEITFKVNSENIVEYKDVTDIITSGYTHEIDVGNLIDGNWHHVYYSSEAPEPSDIDSFNEKITFGLDGELFPKNISYYEEEYPYIQFRKNITKKIKLTSIQPFFEAADLKVPYESLLAPNIVSVGHDNSNDGNNFIGLIDSLRVNEFATFESVSEYFDFYDDGKTPSCFLFVDGINPYCIFDENTKYEISASALSPRISMLPVIRYTENPTTPFEALKCEMGSLAFLKRILGYTFTDKTQSEIDTFLKDWRWKLKFISPTSDLTNTQELEDLYQDYLEEFFIGESLDDTE